MKQIILVLLVISTTFIVAEPPAVEQKLCPVMKGNSINKNIFVEYEGKPVYFCCMSCKAKFLKDPKRYIDNLPQFSKLTVDNEENDHELQNDHFDIDWLIAPLGITTFILIITTAFVGAFMKKNRKLLFPWHRRLAMVTICVAISHFVCVLLEH